jgi:glyoxylase-like metal-dependent hydrolase (beta-lactamase superfamily II)
MYATEVADRVYMLDTYALGQANTVSAYLIKAPKVTLVDCGYASSYESVLAGLAEVGVAPSDVRYVVPTHVHLDHAGAAGRLVREMKNAEVIAHEKSVRHLVDPTKLVESATRVFGAAVVELYGKPEPIPADRITAVGEESNLELGGGVTATLLHTPGHAPHQVSVELDSVGAMLTADAVGIVYPGLDTLIPTTPPPSFNPEELVSSVRMLRQVEPSKLLVPHFGARTDVDWVFESTGEKVTSWVKEVDKMRNGGMSLDGAADAMEGKVKEEAGVDELTIYARVSVRTSVMGIMHYLSKV